MYYRRETKGFTLIELLVVIAIIGILASIVTANLVTAKAKGRDARRISDIRTLQLSLEQYYNDNLSYPVQLSVLVPNYISTMPVDPSTGRQYFYSIFNARNPVNNVCNMASPPVVYHLGAVLEQKTNSALTQDSDVPYNSNYCFSGNNDFDGTSASCDNIPAGAQPTGGEACYDVTN